MDERTLTALQGSIKKWEEIVAGTGEDNGGKNCPLCAEFLDAEGDDPLDDLNDECFGCPVVAKVQETGCAQTPYMSWWEARDTNEMFPLKATTPELVALAQAELDFLKSLLPAAAPA